MSYSIEGINLWFTGGDWRIVRRTVRVKSLLARLSSLFRNVPFLTSLEMSLFLLICLLSLGCPPERSPAPRFVRRV